MFSVVKHYKIWFVFSGLLIIVSAVLLFSWGLRPGIDFRGGTLAEFEFIEPVNVLEMRNSFASAGFGDLLIQPVSETKIIIKTQPLDETKSVELHEKLAQEFGEYKELSFESIGPTISRELVRKAYWQIFLVNLGILFYIAFAFRRLAKDTRKARISSWKFGIAAIVALAHDLLITLGFIAVMGRFRGVEVDSLFVTALLTILGFSVHDTIVIFDRVRENLRKHFYRPMIAIMDHSVISTMARSINTTSTVIFVLVSLLLFGGESTFNFVLTLLFGVVVGTYSSIFIATPLIYLWSLEKTSE